MIRLGAPGKHHVQAPLGSEFHKIPWLFLAQAPLGSDFLKIAWQFKESREMFDATVTIEALEAELADIEALSIEIAKLTAEIEEMEEARSNATQIREAEHAVYMKSKTELEETITSIKECITAMKEGMEGGFLQAKTLIQAWSPKPGLHSRSRVMHMFMQKKQAEDPADKFVGRGGGDATYVAKGGDV